MKCNWCGKGTGRNYTKDGRGKLFYYFCVDCVQDYRNTIGERKNKELISEFVSDLYKEIDYLKTINNYQDFAGELKQCIWIEHLEKQLKKGLIKKYEAMLE